MCQRNLTAEAWANSAYRNAATFSAFTHFEYTGLPGQAATAMTSEIRDEDRPPATVDFHMLKSNLFRVAHADGVFGGLTGSGHVHMTFYSERTPLPQRITHAVDENGALGAEIARYGKTGVVRELEIDVVMNVVVARAFRAWLDEKIVQLETLEKAARLKQDEKS